MVGEPHLKCGAHTLPAPIRRGHAEHVKARPPQSSPAAPPRYKVALLTWLAAYVLITLVFDLLGPKMATWPLALRTLVVSAVMVAMLTWVVMPTLLRLARRWLTPQRS